jgi:hypothetical protein
LDIGDGKSWDMCFEVEKIWEGGTENAPFLDLAYNPKTRAIIHRMTAVESASALYALWGRSDV